MRGFQYGGFQAPGFQSGIYITGTTIIQKPINCVLAGQQDYPQKGEGAEWEARPKNQRDLTVVREGGGGRLSSDAPTFTVKTGNKGYD